MKPYPLVNECGNADVRREEIADDCPSVLDDEPCFRQRERHRRRRANARVVDFSGIAIQARRDIEREDAAARIIDACLL